MSETLGTILQDFITKQDAVVEFNREAAKEQCPSCGTEWEDHMAALTCPCIEMDMR